MWRRRENTARDCEGGFDTMDGYELVEWFALKYPIPLALSDRIAVEVAPSREIWWNTRDLDGYVQVSPDHRIDKFVWNTP